MELGVFQAQTSYKLTIIPITSRDNNDNRTIDMVRQQHLDYIQDSNV